MQLRIETASETEEIVIRCREMTDEIRYLRDIISSVIEKSTQIELRDGADVRYVPKNDILFFETESGRTAAHTAGGMYYTDYRLFELERILPASFMRVSKSCILNSALVGEIHRNIAGASEVRFRDTYKKVYVSRKYLKLFTDKMEEMLKK